MTIDWPSFFFGAACAYALPVVAFVLGALFFSWMVAYRESKKVWVPLKGSMAEAVQLREDVERALKEEARH